MSFYDSIVRGESLKLVLSRDEGQTGELCDVASYYDIIALRRIQTRTDSSTTESEFGKMRKGILQCADAESQLCSVATELLSEGQRRCVHEVRTADLHDVCHFLRLLVEGFLELAKAWEGHFYYLLVASDVHAGGEGVVG